MKLFTWMYDLAMRAARHPRAVWILSAVAFAESLVFFIPPDTLLAPMSLGKPERAFRFALIATFCSVLGGIAAYALGAFCFHWIYPVLLKFGYLSQYEQVKVWFAEYGVWAILIAAFSPVPYNLFTLTGGVVTMPILPFILASCLGRAGRFFLVAAFMRIGGEKMEKRLRHVVEYIGWAVILIAVLVFVYHHCYGSR